MRIIFILAAVVIASVQALAQEPAPIEAYGELPSIRSMAISPDGNKLAYLMSRGEDEAVIVYDYTTDSSAASDTTAVKARGVDFASPGHVLVSASETTRIIGYQGRLEYSAAFSIRLEDGRIRQLLRGEDSLYPAQSGLGRIIGYHDEPKRALMPAYGNSGGDEPPRHLYTVNLDTGRAGIFRRGRHATLDWFVTPDGTVLAREDLDNDDDRYEIWTRHTGDWEKIYEREDTALVPFSLVGITSSQDGLVLVDDLPGNLGEALFQMDLEGNITGPLLVEQGKEIDSILMDENRTVYGVQYSGMRPSYGFFDADLQTAFDTVVETYPTFSIDLVSWSDDWSKAVLLISGGRNVSAYYLMDVASGELSTIANTRSLDVEQVALVESIEYKARDGLTIPSVLTYPLGGGSVENLPLVVLPHGGPESYDQVGFDWMAQFFASRGYLVLQPNFRGSSGFGREFTVAGYGEWGGKMQDDVTDGVTALVQAGMADPDRVCIVGASYGGYAALAGGAFTPDLYKCVVAIAPVTDLPRMLIDERRDHGRNHWVVAYWEKVIGDLSEERDFLREISPVNHADAFTAPVLLIHGRDDTVVPLRQSKRMRDALRRADKDVELIELRGEDHWLSTSETRLETLEAMEAFLAEHLGETF